MPGPEGPGVGIAACAGVPGGRAASNASAAKHITGGAEGCAGSDRCTEPWNTKAEGVGSCHVRGTNLTASAQDVEGSCCEFTIWLAAHTPAAAPRRVRKSARLGVVCGTSRRLARKRAAARGRDLHAAADRFDQVRVLGLNTGRRGLRIGRAGVCERRSSR